MCIGYNVSADSKEQYTKIIALRFRQGNGIRACSQNVQQKKERREEGWVTLNKENLKRVMDVS